MNTRIKSTLVACMLVAVGLMNGCGSDETVATLEGSVIQGPVRDVTVVAKKQGNNDFSKAEASEVSAKTDATGKFKFVNLPTYKYTLVTLTDGTDTLTLKKNIQLIAKGGSKYITPLTTLVATDTTGTIEAKLVALAGKSVGSEIGDVDTSNTTPAAMVLAKTIESTVTAITDSVTASAGTNTISGSQMAAIQSLTLQALATEVAKTATTTVSLAQPVTLTATISSAVTNAIPSITSKNSNIVVAAANVAAIATAVSTNAVGSAVVAISEPTKTIAQAAASTTSALTTTASVIAESSKINTTTAAAIATATSAAVTTVSAVTTVAATPTNYVPPAVTVVVTDPTTGTSLTGATGGTGGSI